MDGDPAVEPVSEAIGAWVKQWDPTEQAWYYYNSVSGESVWDEPSDFVEGVQDEKVEAVAKIQSIFRGKAAREEVKQRVEKLWVKSFDPGHRTFYYYNTKTHECVWEKPSGFVESNVNKEWAAVDTIQRASRTFLAKLRTSIMRRERAKRLARERKERKEDDTAVFTAFAVADERAAESREQAKGSELSYMQQQPEQKDDAPDPSITDWKQMKNMHGDIFYFSPSTGMTTTHRPAQYLEIVPSALDNVDLDDDDADSPMSRLGHLMNDHTESTRILLTALEGDDWMTADWTEPSVEKAVEHRHEMVFHGGHASLWHTGNYQLAAKLGDGISLYFRLLSYLGWMFLVMAIISVPAFILFNTGSKITDDEADPLSLVFTTAGNMGYSQEDIALGNDCPRIVETAPGGCMNQSYTLFFGQPLTQSTAGLYVSITDLVNSVLFFIFLLFFRVKIHNVVEDHKEHHVTATNYSIRVHGLPDDAQEPEIREHFSKLYDLSHMDWSTEGYCCGTCGSKRSRPPVVAEKGFSMSERGHIDPTTGAFRPNFHLNELDHKRVRRWAAEPVRDTSNTANPEYMGSWVAEVSVIHPNGEAIREYVKLKSMQLQVLNWKQRYLKHKHDTLHMDAKVRKAAEKMCKKSLRKIEKLEQKMDKATRHKRDSHSLDCFGAFVVFSEEQSLFRCLDDYHRFSGLSKFLMPKQMKFRGKHRIWVERAPEPSAIVWENLDTPKWNKALRRLLSGLAMIVLLALSLAAIAAASAAKAAASDQLPDFAKCSALPALAFPAGTVPTEYTLVRQHALDGECPGASMFVSYEPPPFAVTDFRDLLTANFTNSCGHPCVSPDDSTPCPGTGNTELLHSTIVGCYCKSALTASIKVNGVFGALSELRDNEWDMCGEFLKDYGTTNALLIVSSIVVVVVNALLRIMLKALSKWERHNDLSAEAKSETFKIFLATWINTGLIVLLVNAKAPELVLFSGAGLFEGEHKDITHKWYSAVGSAVLLTMVLNCVSPHVMPLVKLFCIQPVRTWRARRTAASQDVLNAVYEGPNFDISTRYPIVLNTLFVCMMYSSTMPVLYILGAITFWITFWIDKLSLLRLYNRPPRYDESLAVIAADLMPLSLIIHCGIAVWSYGNGLTVPSAKFGADSDVFSAINDVGTDATFVDRIARPTTLPIFLLLAAVTVWWVSVTLASNVATSIVLVFTCGRGSNAIKDKYKDDMRPPYCGPFREVLTAYEAAALDMRSEAMTEKDKDMLNKKSYKKHGGQWDIIREPDGTRVRVRRWVKGGKKNGIRHARGERLLTWQVIQENALHSYKILSNKTYRRALAAMMADNQDKYQLRPLSRGGSRGMSMRSVRSGNTTTSIPEGEEMPRTGEHGPWEVHPGREQPRQVVVPVASPGNGSFSQFSSLDSPAVATPGEVHV